MPDETEWYVDGWVHLYFCPFCGTQGSLHFSRLHGGWCFVCGEDLTDEHEVIARVECGDKNAFR